MSKIPKKPTRPEEIGVEYIPDPGYQPTPEQKKAIEALKKRVFEHGNEAGVRYDMLGIDTGAPIDPETKCEIFGTTSYQGKTVFIANIHTALAAIVHGTDMEGVVRHEAEHMLENNLLALPKLKTIIEILWTLPDIEDALHYTPDEAKSSICAQFETMEDYAQAISKFNAQVTPIIGFIKENAELFIASPEKFARLMESRDAAYLKLKEDLCALPGVKELKKFQLRTQNISKETIILKRADPYSGQANFFDHVLDVHKKLPDFQEAHTLNAFVENFSKAEEYVVDARAQQYASDPGSIVRFLEWYKNHATTIRDYDVTDVEGDTHPSFGRRIERLHYIREFGAPPPDEYLRQPLRKFGADSFAAHALSSKGDRSKFLETLLTANEKPEMDKDGQER
jgi:hypothetical protein